MRSVSCTIVGRWAAAPSGSAATGSTAPKPYDSSRPIGPTSRAVLISRLTTLAADMVGQRERIRAAVAETSGAAKLVPCTRQ